MRTMVGTVAVLAAILVLSGCGRSDPLPTLPPTPSSTPVFASEEEALAAAEDAYAAYLEVSTDIGESGGADPERIEPFVTPDRMQTELRGAQTLQASGLRLVGASQFETIELQRVDTVGDETEVVFYACWDGSQSRVIDSSGADVTPSDRVDRLVLEIRTVTVNGALPLVLASDDQWPDSSC
jgi:predicted small lipoprotein YifL